mmetsp:Transcript_14699/g.42042  ORF Transcript_14699/g.42042 Transcript_14699/m.42042 type:complete len:669 (-) Transcript_14699:82-2088(-)
MSGGEITLAVSATSSAGTTFEHVRLVDNVRAWPELDHKLTSIPAQLVGGTLIHAPQGGLLSTDTTVTIESGNADSRVYVIAEAIGPANISGRDGGLLTTLASTPRWLFENDAPSWCGEDSVMTMFSTFVQQDTPLVLPDVKEDGAVVLVVVVPVFAGSFSVTIISNSSASYERMAVVEEGIVAWRDRDHRYVSVPSYLLGGILFQGPYKDVPAETVLTVRPNTRARVFVVLERSNSGGLHETLVAKGWAAEAGAPRWHEMPTMLTFSHDCIAGCALVLPPTQGTVAVFSVVVVPQKGESLAPIEVSCSSPAAGPTSRMELVPLTEGSIAWHDETHRLVKVPQWMLGATHIRGKHRGPQAGSVFAIRAAAPSVVYAVVEAELHNRPGRSGGWLPNVFLANSWETREETPEWRTGSSFAVFARRVGACELLCLPPFEDESAVFTLVVKVDVEAFGASLVTSGGPAYGTATVAETALAWSDRQYRLTWVPTFMVGNVLFRGPHCALPGGTAFRIHASGSFRAYVVVESDYKGGTARDGGFLQSLPAAGWRAESSAPGWGDPKSTMKTFSKRAPEGVELVLPPTTGDVVLFVIVANIAASPDRLAEELKQTFRMWDPEGKGGIRTDDLEALLEALCPDLGAEGRALIFARADRRKTGRVNYEEFAQMIFGGS